MGLTYGVFETSLGWMGAVASVSGLRRTTLPQTTPDRCVQLLGRDAEGADHDPGPFAPLHDRLDLYFAGKPVSFDGQALDVDDAPPFMRRAWAECREIPYGETRSYKWLAESAGRPNAPRAAGQSMARNRLPIVIPCHRVIASDGTLGGYGSGASQLDLKRWLLDMEATKS